MSAMQSFEQRIADYYTTEAPSRAPDWLLTRALDVIDTTPQRRTGLSRPWRIPTPSFANLALAAVAIVVVSVVGLTLQPGPVIGPAASSATPSPSPSASPDQRTEAEQIIAKGTLASFAGSGTGSVLTVWETCKGQFETDCGHAWRLGTGSQTHATGMVGHGDVHVHANTASGEWFVLTPAGHHELAFLIARDGTARPLSRVCRNAFGPTPAEAGSVWTSGFDLVNTVTGTYCDGGTLSGRYPSRHAFNGNGVLWGLLDNEPTPDTMTIGRHDGVSWTYRDLTPRGGSATSVIAAAGSNLVVLAAAPESSPQQLVGLSVTTDDGSTWSDVMDPDILTRDLPFSVWRSPNSDDWFSTYTSMAFAGSAVLYVADGRGDLWRSTDFTTFSQVEVAGWVSELTPTGDAVIARFGDGAGCRYPAACRLNDLVRISVDGSVEPVTAR